MWNVISEVPSCGATISNHGEYLVQEVGVYKGVKEGSDRVFFGPSKGVDSHYRVIFNY